MAALLCVALVVLTSACGGTEIDPPKASGDTATTQDAAASDLLTGLARDVADADTDAAVRLAAPRARATVRAVVQNAVTLRLRDVRFRYLSREDDPSAAPAVGAPGSAGQDTWQATVTVSWRLPDDDGPTSVPARFTFADDGSGVRLLGTSAAGDRGALWLSGPVQVARTTNTLVIASPGTASGTSASLSARAVRAVSDVRKVLPTWSGPLVVEAPASEQELERLIGARTGSYTAIAGVTTTVDGTKQAGTPVHVYLNPAVFGTLGPRGAQVVLSHEATHVATRASFATLPTWLLEGFADYVALDHAGIAFTTAAGQVLRRVRREGAPTALPGASDLAPSAGGLGATYEEAWTACRFLARSRGERTLVDFYRAVSDGEGVKSAFREVVGTSQAAFVRAWSSDLAAEAGAS